MDPDVNPIIVINDILYDLSLIKEGKVSANLQEVVQSSINHVEKVCLPEIKKPKYSSDEKNYIENKYYELRHFV